MNGDTNAAVFERTVQVELFGMDDGKRNTAIRTAVFAASAANLQESADDWPRTVAPAIPLCAPDRRH